MSDTNSCMGVYPFNKEKIKTFDSIIKPLVESHTGLTYMDARYYYEPSTIKMDLISKMIQGSSLIIVDLSDKNPNVFMELGIAYNLGKPIVLICSSHSYKKTWKSKMPFDIQGRELLIYNNENELKVKLGEFIFDCLYVTKNVTVSWASMNKDNHIKSPTEIEIFSPGAVWSNVGVNPNFIISYHVIIHNVLIERKNPDIRLYLSNNYDGYPRIINIFPWEVSEMDQNRYECHIDYCDSSKLALRLQQVSVGNISMDIFKEFDVSVSFCWPNLVFESSFFEDKINRLMVPISDFRNRGYAAHLSQFIGFESINSRVTIDKIRIKEVFL
jgi:hypothetical protein